MRIRPLLFLLTFTLLAACALPARQIQPAAQGLSTRVAATLAALTPPPTTTPEPTSTPAPSPTPSEGKVSGKVCYPDKSVIKLNIYFQPFDNAERTLQVSVSAPDDHYAISLPTGRYTIYAWSPDFTAGVLPSKGMDLNLDSTILKDFDLCDIDSEVPYPSSFLPSKDPGSITGRVTGFPGASESQYTVVAFNQGTGYWSYVILMPDQSDFTFSGIDAGRYQVAVYDGQGHAGGTAPDVYVIAGQDTKIGISSWSGTFPDNPVK